MASHTPGRLKRAQHKRPGGAALRVRQESALQRLLAFSIQDEVTLTQIDNLKAKLRGVKVA